MLKSALCSEYRKLNKERIKNSSREKNRDKIRIDHQCHLLNAKNICLKKM